MKFALDRGSLESFNKNKWVELEGFYSPEKVIDINRAIDSLIAKHKWEHREDIMAGSYNLFLEIPEWRRLLQVPLLAEIAYELASVKPLRLASDQLLQAATNTFDQGRATTFLNKTETLEERSSINELVLGVMIALKGGEENLPFAKEPGRVVFFSPQIPIPFDSLKNSLSDRYLLLTFSTQHAQYLYNEKDPQNHKLKKWGYVYGDRLKDSVSPIVYR
jgi:hypothetical protein